jgi:hypothetical protein
MNQPGQSLIRAISAFAAGLMLLSGSALAHIKNEATQFPDIEFSDARFDIVVLVGAGIIPETPVFEPDKRLSRLELATWVALAEGLLPGGETPDIDAHWPLPRANRDFSHRSTATRVSRISTGFFSQASSTWRIQSALPPKPKPRA